jgi:hypothetical protein
LSGPLGCDGHGVVISRYMTYFGKFMQFARAGFRMILLYNYDLCVQIPSKLDPWGGGKEVQLSRKSYGVLKYIIPPRNLEINL